MEIKKMISDKEWQVIQNTDLWRIGLYRPKYRSPNDILELEQHDCPESFILLEGQVSFLYRNKDGKLAEIDLQKGELLTITEPHAGFSPQLDGMALAVENREFTTTYTEKRSCRFSRIVSVKKT